jgi:hypothetical protein
MLKDKIKELKEKSRKESEEWYRRSDLLKAAKEHFLESFATTEGIRYGMQEADRQFVAYLDAEMCRADKNAEFAHGQQIAYIICGDEVKKAEKDAS